MYFLNFPFSEEYIKGISMTYSEKAQDVERQIKMYCNKYIDFNNTFKSEEEDFVDCDHLSEMGAKQMMQLLKKNGIYL